MANYNVDIAVSIKNAEKLSKFNKQIKDVSLNIKSANEFISNFSRSAKLANQVLGDGLVRNVDNLQKNLGLAKTNLKNVALGTKEATIAAYQFVKAQEQLNKGLQEELALIKEVEKGRRFTRFAKAGIRETPNAYSSPIGPGQASSVLGGQSVPVAGKIERILALRRDEIRLQEALLALELKSAEAENQKLQIRGELNRQTAAAVNNARFIGQSSPLTSPVFPGYSGPIGPGQASGLFSGGAFRERLMSNLSASQASREASAFGIRPGVQYDRPIGPAFSAVMKAQLRHQKKIDKNTGKTAQLLSASNNRAIFGDPNAYASPIGPQAARPNFFNRMGFGNRANPQGPFANSRGRAGRLSGSISSGLIGGGFPLLFGQGPLAATGGGIGGLAGGALGGGFGFGLSIAGTAIASRIQETIDFQKAVDKLNVSIRATGGTSLFTAKQVREFAQALGISKDEALEALKAFQQFEASARITLTKFFGSEAIFDTFAGLKDNASIISALPSFSKELSLQQAKIALETLKTNGASAAELKLRELIFDKNTDILKQEREKQDFFGISKDIGLGDLLNPFRGLEFGKGEGNFFQQLKEGTLITTKTVEELKKNRVESFFDSDKFKQDLEDAKERLRIQKEFNEELERQAIIKAPVDELNKLLDPLRQIDSLSKSIGDSFAESFKGIIRGSMSAQDALRNLFQRTADHFADMAARMLAEQIRSGIFGLFKNFLTPSLPSTQQLVNQDIARYGNTVPKGSFNITPKAEGGPVTGGKSYLVGERGPEMFSPGVSGTITPNHALGGSTNIVVNVDASGSSVESEGNGQQFGEALATAIQLEIVKQKRSGGLLA